MESSTEVLEREINSKTSLEMDDAAAIKARAKKNIASARLLRDEAALIKSARVKLNKIADGLNNSPPTNATKITHKAYAKELSNILIDSNVALRIQAYILEKRSIPDYNTIIKDFVRGEANKAGFFSGEKSSPGELDAAWAAYKLRHPEKKFQLTFSDPKTAARIADTRANRKSLLASTGLVRPPPSPPSAAQIATSLRRGVARSFQNSLATALPGNATARPANAALLPGNATANAVVLPANATARPANAALLPGNATANAVVLPANAAARPVNFVAITAALENPATRDDALNQVNLLLTALENPATPATHEQMTEAPALATALNTAGRRDLAERLRGLLTIARSTIAPAPNSEFIPPPSPWSPSRYWTQNT